MKKWISLVLAGSLAASLVGCGGGSSSAGTESASSGETAQTGTEETVSESAQTEESTDSSGSGTRVTSEFRDNIYGFTAKLLAEADWDWAGGANVMLSPLSIVSALSMVTDGAAGDTKEELCQLVRGEMSEEEWASAFQAWFTELPQSEKAVLKSANSIWYAKDAEGITFHDDFLTAAAENYQAEVMGESFADAGIADKINSWVDEKTDHLIPEIVDEVNSDQVMFLINALSFDAEWETPYTEEDVSEGTFTNAADEEQTVEMMAGEETQYLENDLATGFIKQYSGGDYQFVALLPKEGVSVDELIASFDGESLEELVSHPEEETVMTAMPKFAFDYETDLTDALETLGVSDAFSEAAADFSAMADFTESENLYVGSVLHKTHIEVTEQGTKAGAATSAAIMTAGIVEELKSVVLNRPFVYLILDGEAGLPVFAGVVREINNK